MRISTAEKFYMLKFN